LNTTSSAIVDDFDRRHGDIPFDTVALDQQTSALRRFAEKVRSIGGHRTTLPPARNLAWRVRLHAEKTGAFGAEIA
jgi:hypothetical protein